MCTLGQPGPGRRKCDLNLILKHGGGLKSFCSDSESGAGSFESDLRLGLRRALALSEHSDYDRDSTAA